MLNHLTKVYLCFILSVYDVKQYASLKKLLEFKNENEYYEVQ
jgi:hypothetical protein